MVEIARLQNSLVHLKSTQEQLKEAYEEYPDPEFEQAIKENEDVMYVLCWLLFIVIADSGNMVVEDLRRKGSVYCAWLWQRRVFQ